MFRHYHGSGSQPTDVTALASYAPRVRAAHELADLLKRTRPHLYEQVCELQAKVTSCQNTLDAAKSQQQQATLPTGDITQKQQVSSTLDRVTLTALEELETTTQALLDLRHKGQMAK